MTPNKHVFLSYRSLEADFALKLAADLKNEGVKLWMDRLDGIKSGTDWRQAIEQAINVCTAMISVLSPDYVTSEYCRKEMSRANNLKRLIIPVLLRPVKPTEIPFVLEGIHHEDFTNWLDEEEYVERFRKLLQRLKEQSSTSIGNEPDAEVRYLTTLIAELESRRGVLEFVELDADADQVDIRPKPRDDDEWGFSELFIDADNDDEAPTRTTLRSISEEIESIPGCVIVGEPGAGKTTILRKLALDVARKRLANPKHAPLPLLLYLPQWDQDSTPQEFVTGNFPLRQDPVKLLFRGDIWLFLDGLNEMGATGKEKIQQLRSWLDVSDTKPRITLTCRSASYVAPYRFENFPSVILHQLTSDQVVQFAQNYLGQSAAAFLEQVYAKMDDDAYLSTLSDYEKARHDRPSIDQFLRNPYLLSALMIVYERLQEIPLNTGLLFRRLAQALWERERKRGSHNWIAFQEAERRFADLAFSMINDGMPIDVSINYAVGKLQHASLLNVGISASFLIKRGNMVRFYHQLMQEYFAATKLVELSSHQLKRLITPSSWYMVRKATKWDQVVISACGLVQDIDEFIQAVAEVDVFLAAECIGNTTGVSSQLYTLILDRLIESMSSKDTWDATVHALGFMGYGASERLIRLLSRPDRNTLNGAIRALGRLKSKQAVPKLVQMRSDNNTREEARWDIVRALMRIGTEEAIEGLIDAFRDESLWIKRQAYEALLVNAARSIPVLIKRIESSKEHTNGPPVKHMISVLEDIGTPDSIAFVEEWKNRNQ